MALRSSLKIISGGQTGVDRAALDVALELGLLCGGWCPKGRKAEDGSIPPKYPLQETPTEDYPQRTEWNVRDSDGTLILAREDLMGGTKLTQEIAGRLKKPLLVVNPQLEFQSTKVVSWIQKEKIHILNVAGPRESSSPGIYRVAYAFLFRASKLFLSQDSTTSFNK